MSYIKWILFIFLVFLAQTQIALFNVPLNLTVVIVYAYGLKKLEKAKNDKYFGKYSSMGLEIKSTAFGACVGLLEDIIAGGILGPAFLSKGIIGFLIIVIFTDIVFRWTPLIGILAIVAMTVLDNVIVTGLQVLFAGISINYFKVLQILFVQALMNIPFGIIFRPGLHRA
jgi:cell shape-determining protein MreD